jgi:predicted dehydrogenase
MTQLGIGIVGGGFMAEVHSRAARAARARLVGIVSSSPARSASAAQSLGVEAAYDSVELLLADPAVDVVHIATPNATHRELALAAIRAGKHVVCEKPLATSVADAAELVAAAATAGVVATVPFAYRFHPMVREARARLASGGPGRLHSIQGVYLQDWLLDRSDDNWRVDEGQGGPSRAFADIGSHLVDLIEFVTGDRIARVQALTRTVHAERASNKDVTTEDLAAVLFETGSGAVGTLLVSQVAPGRKNRLHVELAGANESVVFDQEHPEALWLGRRAGSEIVTRGEGLALDAARLSILPSGHPLGFQDAFNAFVADSYAAITGDQRDGLPTFDDGLRAVHITQAVIESASTGAWVDTIGIPA